MLWANLIKNTDDSIYFPKFKKMKAAVDNRNWKEAAVQGRDSRWYNQVTNRAERLMQRLENI